MPSSKRPRLAPTDDWAQLQFRFAWAEQASYELVRLVVLFGLTSAERARQTGVSASTVARKAERFENGSHWVRDVVLGEDASLIRSDAAPQVVAACRNL